MERPINFAMLKPLGIQEPLRTEILDHLRRVSEIAIARTRIITLNEVSQLYGPSGHNSEGDKLPHFDAIVNYLSGKLVEQMILIGNGDSKGFIEKVDDIIGPWQPEKSKDGQIRNLVIKRNIPYIFPIDTPEGSNKQVYDNLIHSSDSLESAWREISIFFTPQELSTVFKK